MDLSEEISRLAEEYDPEREESAKTTRAFLQGMLFSTVAAQTPGNPGRILKVIDVDQGLDEDGNYLPYFVVVTESGARIKVTCEVD